MAETLGVTEMLPTKPCVYMLRCLPTQKVYIGSAKNLARRMAAHTAETKAKISSWHKGKHVSEATRRKLSANMKSRTELHYKSGKNNPMYGKHEEHPFFGRKHSAESLKKMSQAKQGKVSKLCKSVCQKTFNGEIVDVYASTVVAERATGIH